MKITLVVFVVCAFFISQACASLTERLSLAHERIDEVRNDINSGNFQKPNCEFIVCTHKCKTCSTTCLARSN